MGTIDTSIMLIALPDIFWGIHIDPLANDAAHIAGHLALVSLPRRAND
jgi:hypothetical protein